MERGSAHDEADGPPGSSSALRPSRSHATAAVVACALTAQAVVWSALWWAFGIARLGYSFFDASDLSYYHELVSNVSQGLVPFRDFFIEYPPLSFLLFMAPGTHLGVWDYAVRFAVLMMLFMAASCAMVAVAASDDEAGPRPYLVAAAFSVCTLLLGPISANRYDAAVALALAIVLLAATRGRWVVTAVVVGVGFALKLTPVVLLPLLLMLAPTERRARMLAGFAVAAGAPFLAVALMGGQATADLAQLIAYHASRPLEIESVLATPFWIGRLLGLATPQVGLAAGSQVLVSPIADALAWLSGVVVVLAVGSVLALVWRGRGGIARDARLQALAVLATLLASLVGSKVLSPQYFIWILPAVALVAVDRRALGAVLAAALLLTHIEFPALYWQFATDQAPVAVAVVVIRNLLLVGAFALTLRHLWRIPGPASEATPSDATIGL